MSTLTLARALEALESLAPLSFASDWDNVGLLVEPLADASAERVLLCIDLTEAVLREALEFDAQLIIAYHPPVFGGLRRLSQGVPLQRSLLGAIRHGIAIYSPHTALDAAQGGVCDWLAEGLGELEASRPIEPIGLGDEARVGAGRIVTLKVPIGLSELVGRIKAHLDLAYLRVACHPRHDALGATVRTIALCPGAGGSLFAQVDEVDVLLTGEMRHHDILERTAAGAAVILSDHSNSERGYLSVLSERLKTALGEGVDIGS